MCLWSTVFYEVYRAQEYTIPSEQLKLVTSRMFERLLLGLLH